MNDESIQAFQVRVENTLAAIVEGISEFQKSMEERMDRIEEEVRQMRIESAEHHLRVDKMQVAIRKGARELSAV